MTTPGTVPGSAAGHDQRTDVDHRRLLGAVRAASAAAGHGLYLGAGRIGWAWAGPEQAVLLLGPPRSGKTTSVVVPNVLAANGPVVSTSTKPDVLGATAQARRRVGRCLVFDPSGTVPLPEGVEPVRWSPLSRCDTWEGAQLMARAMVGSGHFGGTAASGSTGETHWTERAGSLLAPLLLAAAAGGAPFSTVVSWVDRRSAGDAVRLLDDARSERTLRVGAELAGGLLAGIIATDAREQSGIWSTASGVLAAYRSEHALATTADPTFDPSEFCASTDTLYICASGRHQALLGPMVVGLVEDVRLAAFDRSTGNASASAAVPVAGPAAAGSPPNLWRRGDPPVLLALDEVANIAPLPALPSLVSEGGSQGVVVLACLQDLSQARQRWGTAADGFLSLFGTTVVLPGIGDMPTLYGLSALAGEEEVGTRSSSTAPGRPSGGWPGLLAGRRRSVSITQSTVRRPRLPVDMVAQGRSGCALVVDERNRIGWVGLTPSHQTEPFRTLRGPSPANPAPEFPQARNAPPPVDSGMKSDSRGTRHIGLGR